jgi:outer membrane protein assembly factor BamD
LQSLIDRYPLYSKADETLFLLGQAYEGEVEALRKMDVMERERKVSPAQLKADELARERMATDFVNKAAEAYSKILTRYPVMLRSDDAKARLLALHKGVPRPTKAALALNKSEEAGRGEQTMLSKAMGTISRHPDTSSAAKVGDPTLINPTPVSATGIVQAANRVAIGAKGSGSESISAKTINGVGAPPENQPAPRSDTPTTADVPPVHSSAPPPDPNELKPTNTDATADAKTAATPDPNELKPNVSPDPAPAQAPAQVNEITQGSGGGIATDDSSKASASNQELADDNAIASSKHKKKKGIRKVIPFN